MDVRCELKSISEIKADAIAFFVVQDKDGAPQEQETLETSLQNKLHTAITLKDFSAKEGEVLSLYTEKAIQAPRLLIIGVGKTEKLSVEKIRRASAKAAKTAETMNVH